MSDKREMKEPHINKVDTVRKFRLGTRFLTEEGGAFQYGKVDLGVLGKTDKGKILRNIQYAWFPCNGTARKAHFEHVPHRFMTLKEPL